MEKKNKKLLLIVGILVLLVGISYAYFTGVSTFNGSGSSVSDVTATVKGSEVVISGNLEFKDLDILPGHKNISSIKLTATGNAELLPYNLIWNGTNGLNTPLNYTVYKTGEKIETSANCEKKEEALGADKIYYEECSITNLDKLGTKISEGTIKANTTNTKEILAENEFITATSEGTSIYYYVILEYPNLDEEQNADIGGSFKGTVTVEESDAKPDINILAVKIEQDDGTYKDSEDIPQSGYMFDETKSICTNEAIAKWDNANNRVYIDNLTKSGTGCYLYFNRTDAGEEILANSKINQGTPNFKSASTTDEGVYKATDESGKVSYYFRGAVINNYVKFAGKYWRIIRINGDGTIRLIYQGTSATSTGTDAQIGTSAFNTSYNNNMYVGFKYTSGQVHGTGTKSTILETLETWYSNNLASYASKLDTNAGFCGDRTPSTSTSLINNSGGTGTTDTYYGAYIRLSNSTKSPSLECPTEDFYTVNESSNGNKSLTYPIGLITTDEVSMAGGYFSSNTSYYLYNGQAYWTISPSRFNTTAQVIYVTNEGGLEKNSTGNTVYNSYGVRPVINLRADTKFTFTGTGAKGSITNPYVVE